jgi:dienelactone hydrolase
VLRSALNPNGAFTDGGNRAANWDLARGQAYGDSQVDYARQLTEAVIAAAGDKAKVTVVGQSLGGGLATLVAATCDVQAYAFDPAPFAAQLSLEAVKAAARSIGIPLPAGAYDSNDPSVLAPASPFPYPRESK